MLKFRDIRKKFGDNEVLKAVNLEIPTGKVVVILGPSGSGKTTLLRCGNLLETPDAGIIELDDLVIDSTKFEKWQMTDLRQHTTMVFQNYNLFKNKTALENVMEGLLTVQKKSAAEAKSIAEEYLTRVGLADRMLFYPSQLSGGQQQRVGIARALALSPKVIFFDEPTAALDPELVGEVLEVMKKVALFFLCSFLKKCKTFLHFLSFSMPFFIANTINISAKTTLYPPTVRVRENVSLVLVGGEILFIIGKLCLKASECFKSRFPPMLDGGFR
jgi:L-cystine transport system ATP-binding protein